MRGVDLFSSVTPEEMQAARIVTGATMAAFIGIGLAPGLRRYARRIRFWLLGLYLLSCAALVGHVVLR